jgi:glycosyltransferase involved in cell wall biosynthesis
MLGVTVSIVIPVYNEGEGLCLLAQRLKICLGGLDTSWEALLIDDHSTDSSPSLIKEICAEEPRFRSLRLARNSGSHVAVLAGLEHARGDCAVFLAADLQDPPELIEKMLELWRQGHQVVWAVRDGRERIPLIDRVTAKTFYWLLNRLGDVAVPPDGADFALVDRRIIRALGQSVGANPNILAEIARLGFSQAQLPYVKEARRFGNTKWNLRKKLKMFADSLVSFSYAPLRAMSYLGICLSIAGFAWALVVLIGRIMNRQPVSGYASLMVVTLIIGGFQMIMLGVLGEYLWRTLDEARHRPKYLIEEDSAASVAPELESLGQDMTSRRRPIRTGR